ncbi:MAG TPA: hypothetical protein P5550_11440, partial [Bacteroidales bacterium]|nr:hypothetical protein [Bacteroidales bacterium]
TVGQEVVGLVDAPQPEPAPGNEVGQTPEPLPVAGPVALPAERAEPIAAGSSERKEEVSGRVGATSYTRFSNQEDDISQRWRYSLALQARHIQGSRLSAETNIAFSHRDEQWELIRANVYEGLKVYNLSLRYEATDALSLRLGRSLNPRISGMGAVDGLQVEYRAGALITGLLLGSRPDLKDYRYDPSLLQAGAYVSHERKQGKAYTQSTLALVEQRNQGHTDRRFTYLQHARRLFGNLYFFGSGEFDLYSVKDGQSGSDFRLTNAFLSLRYDPLPRLRLSGSYSARNNIIYYETYKSLIDKLMETEALQGFRLGASYRPWDRLMLGVQGSYRSRPDDPAPSRSLYAYITRTDLPWLHAAVSLTATVLETSYLNGAVYGISLTRDFFNGKINGDLGYRYTDYSLYGELPLTQHVGEVGLSWRLRKGLDLRLSEEATWEQEVNYHRLFVSLRQRF